MKKCLKNIFQKSLNFKKQILQKKDNFYIFQVIADFIEKGRMSQKLFIFQKMQILQRKG